MATTTGTVIQNGCCYTVTKIIKNGAEIELGGGSGTKCGYVDFLVVGGGGAGGISNPYEGGNGGGGAGGFLEGCCYPINNIDNSCVSIKVGRGGVSGEYGCGSGSCSCFLSFIAYGGGEGQSTSSTNMCVIKGASGGGGGSCGSRTQSDVSYGGGCVEGQGNKGGDSNTYGRSGAGGGGAGTAGCDSIGSNDGGAGGCGKCSCISGQEQRYSGGGGGFSRTTVGASGGCGGGGNGGGLGCGGCNATYYGGGGGGGSYYQAGGSGCQGIVIIRYKKTGSGLKRGWGGCVYECGDYFIHCFTNTDTIEQFIPAFK